MTASTHLGRNIRSIRLLQGMKQELFARKLGISQQQVSKLERQPQIPADRLEIIAKALNVSVGKILAFDERTVVCDSPMAGSIPMDGSVKEMLDYFMAELSKKDRKIEELEAELQAYRNFNDRSVGEEMPITINKNH